EVFDGRVVTCSRGASAVPISEYVLAAMLAFEKRLPQSWSREPPEHWGWATDHGTLEGKTLGVVGLGSIGGGVAARALPFGMDVRAVRRTAAPSPVVGVTEDGRHHRRAVRRQPPPPCGRRAVGGRGRPRRGLLSEPQASDTEDRAACSWPPSKMVAQ